MAGRQPGVWLGGPNYMAHQHEYTLRTVQATELPRDLERVAPLYQEKQVVQEQQPPTADEHNMALLILGAGDYRLCYTVALALQIFAEQVEHGSMEREKQYSSEECLRLAQALMDLIPADWDPQPEEEATADGQT